MNIHERAETVRAMERLIRGINDEELILHWLTCGVADGEIDGTETDDDLDYWTEDENFAELMELFMKLMKWALLDGGLYIDGVLSMDEVKRRNPYPPTRKKGE